MSEVQTFEFESARVLGQLFLNDPENLRAVEEKLGSRELGEPIRQQQSDILRDIDKLIKKSENPQGGGGGASCCRALPCGCLFLGTGAAAMASASCFCAAAMATPTTLSTTRA